MSNNGLNSDSYIPTLADWEAVARIMCFTRDSYSFHLENATGKPAMEHVDAVLWPAMRAMLNVLNDYFGEHTGIDKPQSKQYACLLGLLCTGLGMSALQNSHDILSLDKPV